MPYTIRHRCSTASTPRARSSGVYSDGTGRSTASSSSGGAYTTLDDPSATHGTLAFGINDAGQIVGYYVDSTGNGQHGFLLSGGIYTTLDDPLATSGTYAFGINAAGQIVGAYLDASGDARLPPVAAAVRTPRSTIPWPPAAPLPPASTMPARSSGITATPAA